MEHTSFYQTIVKNIFWKAWVKENELRPHFDVNESMECDLLSDRHFNAFLKFSARMLDSSWKKRHQKLLKKYNRLSAQNIIEK